MWAGEKKKEREKPVCGEEREGKGEGGWDRWWVDACVEWRRKRKKCKNAAAAAPVN